MGILNSVKEGADLTHPKASIGWATGAIVAVIILMLVVAVASYLYKKGSSAVGGAGKTVEQTVEQAFGTGA